MLVLAHIVLALLRRWVLQKGPAVGVVLPSAFAAIAAPPAVSEAPPTGLLEAVVSDEPQFTSVGKPWTRRLMGTAPTTAADVTVPQLPTWLAGTWNVSAKFVGVKLPLSRGSLSLQTPGVRMASALVLPNVGGEPNGYLQRFGATADVTFNVPTSVEAYWPGSNVTVVDGAGSPRRIRVAVQPPTGQGKEVGDQRIDLEAVHAAWMEAANGTYAYEQVFRQKNVDAAFDGDYLVLQSFSPLDPGVDGRPQRAESRLRLAAFSHPSDANYMETGGKAVIIYDYALNLSRVR